MLSLPGYLRVKVSLPSEARGAQTALLRIGVSTNGEVVKESDASDGYERGTYV